MFQVNFRCAYCKQSSTILEVTKKDGELIYNNVEEFIKSGVDHYACQNCKHSITWTNGQLITDPTNLALYFACNGMLII